MMYRELSDSKTQWSFMVLRWLRHLMTQIYLIRHYFPFSQLQAVYFENALTAQQALSSSFCARNTEAKLPFPIFLIGLNCSWKPRWLILLRSMSRQASTSDSLARLQLQVSLPLSNLISAGSFVKANFKSKSNQIVRHEASDVVVSTNPFSWIQMFVLVPCFFAFHLPSNLPRELGLPRVNRFLGSISMLVFFYYYQRLKTEINQRVSKKLPLLTKLHTSDSEPKPRIPKYPAFARLSLQNSQQPGVMYPAWGLQSMINNTHCQHRPDNKQTSLTKIAGMTFRSLQMSQLQIIIPRDSYYTTINMLGYENVLHFSDSGDPAHRNFSHYIKRCDQCLNKIGVISQAMRKEGVDLQEYEEDEPEFVSRLRQNWQHEAKSKGVEQEKLIDIYEERVTQEYRLFQGLMERVDGMSLNRRSTLDKIACLEVLAEFFGDSQPKYQSQQYYVNNISQARQIQNVSFLVGVIDNEAQFKISKIIYRVSRGYACTKTLSQFKFYGLKNYNKKVMLVIYPTSSSVILQTKLKRVMETFCDNHFLFKQYEYNSKPAYQKEVDAYNEISSLIEMTQKQYKLFMGKLRNTLDIENWRLFFWKERTLFQHLDKLDCRDQFYIANVYLPKSQIRRVSIQISRIVPTPAIHELSVENPPTAFNTNDFTSTAQQITNTYGVPRYQQVNPSIFTTITFPFFFGVMFGDVAHGAMILALGLYLIANKQKLQKGMFRVAVDMRYMVTLMGFFAVYCGFIYNDIAGFNMNLFSSCFNPPLHPDLNEPREDVHLHSRPNCVYPFGVDPVWGRAQNELVFVNSLKMKISVIIAIIHMTLGVCVKAANSLYFRKKLDFYFQFIPQLVFLVGLFGYMDFLIIFKWLKSWTIRYDDTAPQQWAPSIIATMMNIGLDLGRTSIVPDGNSNMWGKTGSTSQDTIQAIILVVAFVCVPLMLIPKPYIQISQNRKKQQLRAQNPLENEQPLLEDSRDALQQQLAQPPVQPQPHEQASQIVVHQLIQTIEFVLGTVSNTASYLRLWALSLAHSQLSKVFFQQVTGRLIGQAMFLEIAGMFMGGWLVMWITFGIILCMDSMECFLHSLRLHWVEFQNKFYKGDGYHYVPFSFGDVLMRLKKQHASD